MICINCKHDCHCGDTCQVGNGCGCSTCEHNKKINKKWWQFWK